MPEQYTMRQLIHGASLIQGWSTFFGDIFEQPAEQFISFNSHNSAHWVTTLGSHLPLIRKTEYPQYDEKSMSEYAVIEWGKENPNQNASTDNQLHIVKDIEDGKSPTYIVTLIQRTGFEGDGAEEHIIECRHYDTLVLDTVTKTLYFYSLPESSSDPKIPSELAIHLPTGTFAARYGNQFMQVEYPEVGWTY